MGYFAIRAYLITAIKLFNGVNGVLIVENFQVWEAWSIFGSFRARFNKNLNPLISENLDLHLPTQENFRLIGQKYFRPRSYYTYT